MTGIKSNVSNPRIRYYLCTGVNAYSRSSRWGLVHVYYESINCAVITCNFYEVFRSAVTKRISSFANQSVISFHRNVVIKNIRTCPTWHSDCNPTRKIKCLLESGAAICGRICHSPKPLRVHTAHLRTTCYCPISAENLIYTSIDRPVNCYCYPSVGS
ncbi:hypothetical protein D3C81_1654990 [compost metagenome]